MDAKTLAAVRRADRMDAANRFIGVVSSCGRRFFRHGDRVGRLELDRGLVFYVDPYTERRIYTHYNGGWKGFTAGGTLRLLVIALREFVRTGRRFHPHTLGGDVWGYGDDMEKVREAARDLGLL